MAPQAPRRTVGRHTSIRTKAPVTCAGVAIVVAALTACGGGAGGESSARHAATQRDSGGITIVDNVDPTGVDGDWRIDSAAAVRIGEAETTPDDERYQFDRIQGVARMANGEIVVADWGSTQVRIFDSTGRFARLLVRKGGGPGELYTVSKLYHTRDDTVVVYNGEGSVLAVFGPDLRLVRTVKPVEFRHDSLRQPYSHPGVRGVFDDGTILGSTRWSSGADRRTDQPGQPWGLYAESTFFARGTTEGVGRQLAEYGWLSERRGQYAVMAPGSYLMVSWYQPAGMYAVRGTEVYYVDGRGMEIRVYGADGRLHRLIRARQAPVAVDPTEAERLEAAMVASQSQRKTTAVSVPVPKLPPPPSHHPVAEALHVDRDGNIWVRTTVSATPVRRVSWLVFDSTGSLVHRLPDAAPMQVMEIGRDYMLGVTRDSLGVESVLLRRIVKK
jgi:hypothetical protein